MIHQAARDMVLTHHGPDVWQTIAGECGLGNEHFISAQSYSDEITLGLIAEISRRTGTELDALLEQFGRHWLGYAENTSYGNLLTMAGDDLPTFLGNLDRMHAGIKTTMPQTSMPSFALEQIDENHLKLVYRSQRTGLAPFVRGLLLSLMDRFGVSGEVVAHEQDDRVLFDITLRRSEAA